jgi:hypothetical protein
MRTNKNSKLDELTVKLITEKYNALIEDVQTNDYYTRIDLTNRVNCYQCPGCKDVTKTKDVDRGVTPAMISCSWCGSVAHSTFYKDIAPYRLHTKEWYRPSLEEVLEIAASKENAVEHILMGGLVMRDVSIEDENKNALELLERLRKPTKDQGIKIGIVGGGGLGLSQAEIQMIRASQDHPFVKNCDDLMDGMLLKAQERSKLELSEVKFQGIPFHERTRPHDDSVISENPKHRNGRYNPVNRNKNKAARKARKQNRR